jgi:CheY-like chemotaxis protein
MPATILIADDDPDILELITALLTEEGFQTVGFNDGLAALHHIRAQRPAVAIIDMAMPVMDGRELIERLRQEPGPQLPVIAMSAAFHPSSIQPLEVEAYLTKPFDLEELLEQVNYFSCHQNTPNPSSTDTSNDAYSLTITRQSAADGL